MHLILALALLTAFSLAPAAYAQGPQPGHQPPAQPPGATRHHGHGAPDAVPLAGLPGDGPGRAQGAAARSGAAPSGIRFQLPDAQHPGTPPPIAPGQVRLQSHAEAAPTEAPEDGPSDQFSGWCTVTSWFYKANTALGVGNGFNYCQGATYQTAQLFLQHCLAEWLGHCYWSQSVARGPFHFCVNDGYCYANEAGEWYVGVPYPNQKYSMRINVQACNAYGCKSDSYDSWLVSFP